MADDPNRYFTCDYFTARDRFLDLARRQGAHVASYAIAARGPKAELLSIDTAYIGAPRPRQLLIVTSGTHGVEGFAGSAIQQQWLDSMNASALSRTTGYLLVHAVNPYGFAWCRRTNEHNVDLNRNALAKFPGPQNAAYARLHTWLNPETAPRWTDFFWIRGLWHLLSQGAARMKQAIAGGQYEFPRGMFYGGQSSEQSIVHLADILNDFACADRVVAIDIHTGLGRFGVPKLLVDFDVGSPAHKELQHYFGPDTVICYGRGSGYDVSGGLTELIARQFTHAQTYPAFLEFGTVSSLRMLATLRRENWAFFHDADGPRYRSAKAKLFAVFCPKSDQWRRLVLQRGTQILNQAEQLLLNGACIPQEMLPAADATGSK